MKAVSLAAATIVMWAYGFGVMIVAFSDNVVDRFLGSIYPLVLLISLVGIIGYIVDALRSARVPQDKRGLWAVVLLLGHIFAQPFYWWWYVRPRAT